METKKTISVEAVEKLINEVSAQSLKIEWKREGKSLEFKGIASEDVSEFKPLKINLRRNALVENNSSIQRALNELDLDCNSTVVLNEAKSFFLLEIKVKALTTSKIKEKEEVKPTKEKTQKTEKVAKEDKKPGVLETILKLIKEGPQTKATILKSLVEKFPERTEEAMNKTVNAQLGGKADSLCRMEKERNVIFQKTLNESVMTFEIKK